MGRESWVRGDQREFEAITAVIERLRVSWADCRVCRAVIVNMKLLGELGGRTFLLECLG
jgi:hypothetical protein